MENLFLNKIYYLEKCVTFESCPKGNEEMKDTSNTYTQHAERFDHISASDYSYAMLWKKKGIILSDCPIGSYLIDCKYG